MDTCSMVSQLGINSLSTLIHRNSLPTTMDGVPRVSERIVTFLNSMISFVAHQPTAVNFEACYKTSRSLNHVPAITTTQQGHLGCRHTFLFMGSRRLNSTPFEWRSVIQTWLALLSFGLCRWLATGLLFGRC